MDWRSVVGMVAAFSTTFSFLPQAIKTIRIKDTSAISAAMYGVFSLGTLMWLLYALTTNNLPVILANAVSLLFAPIILY